MTGIPRDVTSYLAAVADRVSGVFGPELVGVYATGSLALGDYRPGRSDIDVMAVVEGRPDPMRCRVIAARLDHGVLPCPAAGLEFVLYPRETVTSAEPIAGYALNLNTGSQLVPVTNLHPEKDQPFWYVIDRAVTYQSGWPLVGPSPKSVFRALPFPTLLRVVTDSVAGHARPENGHLLDNAVLNGCRALRFAEDKWWYSKLRAAQRTLPSAGQFVPLISAAMAAFRQGRQDGGRLLVDDVAAFLDHVITGLRRACEGSGVTRDYADASSDD